MHVFILCINSLYVHVLYQHTHSVAIVLSVVCLYSIYMYKNAVVMNTHSTCTCILLHHYTGRTTSEYCEEFLSSTAMDTLKRAGLDLIFCLQKVNPLMPKVESLPSSRLHPPIQYVYINLRHNTVQYSAVCRCSPSRIEAKIHMCL